MFFRIDSLKNSQIHQSEIECKFLSLMTKQHLLLNRIYDIAKFDIALLSEKKQSYLGHERK